MPVDIVSLLPYSALVQQPSWRAAFGWERNRDIGCEKCAPFFLEGGIGPAARTSVWRREVWYVMLEGSAEYHERFEEGHRAGLGIGAGVLVDLAEGWRAALTGRRIRYTEGDVGTVGEAALEQRFTVTRNLELRLDVRGVEAYREAMLGLGYHF